MDIQQLLDTKKEELYELLGNQLSESEKSLNFPKLGEKKTYAQKWLKDRLETFRQEICQNEQLKNTVSAHFDEIEVISAIADIIAGYCINISPFVVAVLLYKYGVLRLCSGIWKIN